MSFFFFLLLWAVVGIIDVSRGCFLSLDPV